MFRLRNYSTIKNTWCYKKGYYQMPYIYKLYIISYSKWFQRIKKPINRIDRQKKIKEFFDQY